MMGAGALGSIAAALLHQAGYEVALIARGARAEHLRTNGVKVEGLAEVTVTCPIVTDCSTLTEADLLILTVKTFDTEAALKQLAHMKVANCLSLQNGMRKEDQLAAFFGSGAVLGATANFSGGMRDDGVALYTVNNGITIGEVAGGLSPRVETVCRPLADAGIAAIPSADVMSAAWSKLVLWAGSAAVTGIIRDLTHRVLRDPDGARYVARTMREAGAIAKAEGAILAPIPPYPVQDIVQAPDIAAATALVQQVGEFFHANAPQHTPSILQDLERGKRLEVDETLGDLVARGARLGIPVPTVDAAYRTLAAKSRLMQSEDRTA